MIGHAYPVGDSGWSVLELGELDRSTLTLRITGYQVTNRDGDAVGEPQPSLVLAMTMARACSENRQSVG